MVNLPQDRGAMDRPGKRGQGEREGRREQKRDAPRTRAVAHHGGAGHKRRARDVQGPMVFHGDTAPLLQHPPHARVLIRGLNGSERSYHAEQAALVDKGQRICILRHRFRQHLSVSFKSRRLLRLGASESLSARAPRVRRAFQNWRART
eukprot:906332-Pleurochrysis_carterae.AAC.2